ncbi:hypothetical protein OBV_27510 [Oscillibacter valericigenes Sjm18-20]|nr:hypothetical protein OBV_27510 [Oscillibacter valericigenes Sjm18-20]
MQKGYGKHEIIVNIQPDKDSLIGKLLEISDKADELSSTASSLIRDLQETGDES